MPNDIANNMADTIRFLEEENASLTKAQVDLQLAYNEQMIELREAKRLLKLAVEDLNIIGSCKTCVKSGDICRGCRTDYKWVHADEAFALIGEEGEYNG